MKKTLVIIILLILSIQFLHGQTNKEFLFEETIFKVINFYNKKDSVGLNKLINKDIGIYFIAKPAATDFGYHCNKVSFSRNYLNLPTPIPRMMREQLVYEDFPVEFANKIIVDCDTIHKEGLFVEKAKNHYLSETMRFANQHKLIEISDVHINKIREFENKSRRIIILKKSEGIWPQSFIFHLSYIKNAWCLTVIDFATLDCSS